MIKHANQMGHFIKNIASNILVTQYLSGPKGPLFSLSLSVSVIISRVGAHLKERYTPAIRGFFLPILPSQEGERDSNTIAASQKRVNVYTVHIQYIHKYICMYYNI